MIIVIDGPAGSGKSTTAKAVADKLQIEYLDSGALYRAVTLIYLEANRDSETFFRLLDQKKITFYYIDSQFHVCIDGASVTDQIRTPEVANLVSKVAAMPKVRTFVNELMRDAVTDGIYIAEGRDLGTAVFPDAKLKFYMDADLSERARRRYNELKKDNPGLTYREVKLNIAERDRQDTSRDKDPLIQSKDALSIDTTDLTFEQQVDRICLTINEQLLN
ncbi:cytidylate kinase [Fodinibius salinus]|uniref:Cytidylate kinase n=1 Tax=Fodinibius salinus TaxID=860790 RepID=A0A5D3YN86_9BACT|nr:(d)CMP kinase [Fodinibius salinus]TYP95596.1 cytidylate kinase [Fodinibius salinus]